MPPGSAVSRSTIGERAPGSTAQDMADRLPQDALVGERGAEMKDEKAKRKREERRRRGEDDASTPAAVVTPAIPPATTYNPGPAIDPSPSSTDPSGGSSGGG
jgi:hypothetical protein